MNKWIKGLVLVSLFAVVGNVIAEPPAPPRVYNQPLAGRVGEESRTKVVLNGDKGTLTTIDGKTIELKREANGTYNGGGFVDGKYSVKENEKTGIILIKRR